MPLVMHTFLHVMHPDGIVSASPWPSTTSQQPTVARWCTDHITLVRGPDRDILARALSFRVSQLAYSLRLETWTLLTAGLPPDDLPIGSTCHSFGRLLTSSFRELAAEGRADEGRDVVGDEGHHTSHFTARLTPGTADPATCGASKLTWRLTSPIARSHREVVFEESHALLSSSLLYLEVSRGYATALTVPTIKYARGSLPRYVASYLSSLLIHYGLMHFNTLSRQWSLSLLVYNVLLDSANTNDELHVLRVSGARGITRSEGQAFHYKLMALSDPSIFGLQAWRAVLATQVPLFALLQTFFSNRPDDPCAWQQVHAPPGNSACDLKKIIEAEETLMTRWVKAKVETLQSHLPILLEFTHISPRYFTV
ncbi:hypothetical protein EDB86DRAFT_2831573 [Lactarius hatsudake]|nr:hypothetical protein EDB86DRAFT_2831573 [Lactarius hatsudake]